MLSAVGASEQESGLLSPDQMGGYAVSAIFVVIGLAVSYLILKKFLFKPMIRLINQRKESVTSDLADAAAEKGRAEEMLKEADKQIQDAKCEASELISEARSQAEKQAQSVVDSAQREAEEVRKKAADEAKHLHDDILDQMRDEIADLAVSIASKVIGTAIDESRQKEWVEKTVDETIERRERP